VLFGAAFKVFLILVYNLLHRIRILSITRGREIQLNVNVELKIADDVNTTQNCIWISGKIPVDGATAMAIYGINKSFTLP
jgi:hypothetical protein